MPHIALTTGGCDNLGCMLPKVGIDPAEFGYESDGYAKAINVYNGDETTLATWNEVYGTNYTAPPATAAMDLWGSQAKINTYDMAIFSCECSEAPGTKGSAGAMPFQIVTDYLAAGGRIFTTDFQYTWYKFSTDPAMGGTPIGSDTSTIGLGEIIGGAPSGGDPITLSTTFPKGAALAAWLKAVFPTDMYASMGEVDPDVVFSNIQSVDSSAVTWASSPDPTGPRVFTVDTPVEKPTAQQCGRGVHLDAHIDQPGTSTDTVTCSGSTCYPNTCPNALKPDEAMFAFFFFDLASCIQNEMMAPQPPPVPVPQ